MRLTLPRSVSTSLERVSLEVDAYCGKRVELIIFEDMEREDTRVIRFDALDGSVVKLPDGRNELLSFTGEEICVEGSDRTVICTYGYLPLSRFSWQF